MGRGGLTALRMTGATLQDWIFGVFLHKDEQLEVEHDGTNWLHISKTKCDETRRGTQSLRTILAQTLEGDSECLRSESAAITGRKLKINKIK